MACGLLNVNKPSGLTSRRVVDRVQRLVRPAKAGHAGTLDPLATGVLLVGVGAATRLLGYVQQLPKAYVGRFLLGCSSPTDDVEGPLTPVADAVIPSRDEIQHAVQLLTGQILQQPPAYSAIKVQGRRAYDLARRQQPVNLPERPVTVYAMEILSYEYPELTLAVRCSAGTYVRALGRDLARSLSTAAVMAALVRTAIGEFRLDQAVEFDHLTDENWAAHLAPPLCAVPGLPQVCLSDGDLAQIRHGRTIAVPPSLAVADGIEVAAIAPDGRLVAILTPRAAGRLGPTCNLTSD